MAETRLVLIRHGHHDPAGRFMQHTCEGLTPEGVRQAELLADRFASTIPAGVVHAVLTSRAARAIQTAEILGRGLGIAPAAPTCDLCELHPGQAEGLTYPEMAARFGPNYAQVPGAEYFPDWLPRATAALHRIAAQHRGRTVVAVTHNGVVVASFVAFARMPSLEAQAISIDNTGITTWAGSLDDDDPRAGVWRLERHNDTAHLM